MKYLLILLALPIGAAAHAQERSSIDGNALLARCAGGGKPGMAQACDAYVQGVADAVSVYQEAAKAAGDKPAENRICVPAAVTGTKMRETVVAWLRDHAADRNRPSGNLVVHVLRDTWPCH